jgi:hypothetical protein
MRTYQLIAVVLIVLVILTVVGYVIWNGAKRNHLPLYEEIYEIKSRLLVNITDPAFPSTGTRECVWFELREEDSGDYFQTTVNFWVFQPGQGIHGDIEAFVEIYNVPDRTDRFVIEVTRNCWFELTVSYNGVPFVVFPTVTENAVSYGYMTYEVTYNVQNS